jgi:hypothetical protein
LDTDPPGSWLPWGAGKPALPSKVVTVWSDAVLQNSGGPATRGFGGRLVFFRPGEETPVRVDGTLVVYAFDEGNRNSDRAKPDRKYVFTPEQFATHYSKNQLGHSYSVWLPWDEAGGPKREVSLVARFTPVDGPTIVGEHTKLILRGKSKRPAGDRVHSREITRRKLPDKSAVTPVAHHAPVADNDDGESPEATPRRRMVTTTIPIRPTYGRTTPVARTSRLASRRAEIARRARARATSETSAASADLAPTGLLPGPPEQESSTSPSTRSPRAGFQAPALPYVPPTRGRGPWQPPPSGSPSDP